MICLPVYCRSFCRGHALSIGSFLPASPYVKILGFNSRAASRPTHPIYCHFRFFPSTDVCLAEPSAPQLTRNFQCLITGRLALSRCFQPQSRLLFRFRRTRSWQSFNLPLDRETLPVKVFRARLGFFKNPFDLAVIDPASMTR